MMWQDLVFTIGSGLSIVFLAPTLRDAAARVPLGTSLPSMAIGLVYGITFATLGMTFSAVGATMAGSMWALIAIFRSPGAGPTVVTRRERVERLAIDVLGRAKGIVTDSRRTWDGDHDHEPRNDHDHEPRNEYGQLAD